MGKRIKIGKWLSGPWFAGTYEIWLDKVTNEFTLSSATNPTKIIAKGLEIGAVLDSNSIIRLNKKYRAIKIRLSLGGIKGKVEMRRCITFDELWAVNIVKIIKLKESEDKEND